MPVLWPRPEDIMGRYPAPLNRHDESAVFWRLLSSGLRWEILEDIDLSHEP